MIAFAGMSGSAGAFRWTSFAMSTMRRRDVEDPSGPKETAWKDKGLLAKQANISREACTPCYIRTHPSATALRHIVYITLSPTLHSPSDRKMTIGILFVRSREISCSTTATYGTDNEIPLSAPAFVHNLLRHPQRCVEVGAASGIVV